MEFRHLRYVVAVAEAGNLSAAGERVGVAKQALSTQIRRLERALGLTLFIRTPHGMHCTPAGAELVARATRILTEHNSTEARMRRLAAQQRPLAVALTGVPILDQHLRVALQESGEMWQAVHLTQFAPESEQRDEALRRHHLDLALRLRDSATPDVPTRRDARWAPRVIHLLDVALPAGSLDLVSRGRPHIQYPPWRVVTRTLDALVRPGDDDPADGDERILRVLPSLRAVVSRTDGTL